MKNIADVPGRARDAGIVEVDSTIADQRAERPGHEALVLRYVPAPQDMISFGYMS